MVRRPVSASTSAPCGGTGCRRAGPPLKAGPAHTERQTTSPLVSWHERAPSSHADLLGLNHLCEEPIMLTTDTHGGVRSVPESPTHRRRSERVRRRPASSKGLNSQRGFGPAVEPRRKSRPRSTSLHGGLTCGPDEALVNGLSMSGARRISRAPQHLAGCHATRFPATCVAHQAWCANRAGNA